MYLDKRMPKGFKIMAALSMLMVSSLFFASDVFAQSFDDTCCVYFDEGYTESSAQCLVMDFTTQLIRDDIPIFDCNLYEKTSDGCDNGEVPIGNEGSTCLESSEVVFPEELRGTVIQDKSVAQCPSLDGYSLQEIKANASHPYCGVGNILLNKTNEGGDIKTAYEESFAPAIDAEKQKILNDIEAIKNQVDDVQKNTCCIPNTPTYKTRCFAPEYTTYGSDLFGFLSNPFQTLPLASLYTDKPVSGQNGSPPAENNPQNAYYYLTCGNYTDTHAVKYSCNSGQTFAPPEYAGGGAGIEVSLKAYCQIPDATAYCACPTDGNDCNKIAFTPYKKTSSSDTKKADYNCTEFIKNKPGWECTKTTLQPACNKWELICDYSDGVAKDCKCPNAGKEIQTDECKHITSKNLPKIPEYDGIPLNIEEIQALGSGLNKNKATSFAELAGLMLRALIAIIGSIALAMFVYGGVMVMTAAGNDERQKKGTEILVWSALGVIMVLSAYAFTDLVFEILR